MPRLRAADLLAQYRDDDTLLCTAGGGLLLRGAQASIRATAPVADLPAHAAGLAALDAAQGGPGVVAGAVPFDPAGGARLTVPAARIRSAPPVGQDVAPAAGPGWRAQAVPAPQAYQDGVAAAVRRLRAGELAKVVLARAVELTAPAPIVLRDVLRRLIARDPVSNTFAVPIGAGRVLLGSSPELLVRRRGRTVVSHPLAGSAARSPDPAEDGRRAAALLASAKDHREHALVVDAVRAVLAPRCASLRMPERPTLTKTATMWHLGTEIVGELADPAPSALDLALALHPTPAVCGTPPAAARALIGATEGFDRGFFAGTLGWVDAAGDGEWFVTIRCAEAAGASLRVFAGAGVVAESDPAAELAETAAKLRTLTDALGVDPQVVGAPGGAR